MSKKRKPTTEPVIKVPHQIGYVVLERKCEQAVATLCPECGPSVPVNEDGECVTCGATATGAWVKEHVLRDEGHAPFEEGFTSRDAELLAKSRGLSGVAVVAIGSRGVFWIASHGVTPLEFCALERADILREMREHLVCTSEGGGLLRDDVSDEGRNPLESHQVDAQPASTTAPPLTL